jgi:hypothetical protein
MTTNGYTDFFRKYVDPLKHSVAEWGAFTGYHGRERGPAMEQVKKLAATALVAADLVIPNRVESARAKLASTEASRARIRARLHTAYCRCIGTVPFSSHRPHRIIIEGVFDLMAFLGLPLALMASWPLSAFRRRALFRIEREEGAMTLLAKAAEDYLATEFEWHFQKGEEARLRADSATRRSAVYTAN